MDTGASSANARGTGPRPPGAHGDQRSATQAYFYDLVSSTW